MARGNPGSGSEVVAEGRLRFKVARGQGNLEKRAEVGDCQSQLDLRCNSQELVKM